MVREYKVGDEPVPGYRLAELIGRGGFGAVWRAVGPGRAEVALKIIGLDRQRGLREFRSLRFMKRIRHPNLVPVVDCWLIDAEGAVLDDESSDVLAAMGVDAGGKVGKALTTPGGKPRQIAHPFNMARVAELVVATGLCEKDLVALLKDFQSKGQSGVPLEDLLDYMDAAARAIDFLNTPRHDLGGPQPVAIQHCDVKPQNIMLIGNAAQLGDFGLARSLDDVRSTSMVGSIAYGAPELYWENKPTHGSDQYSLAITYYEMRTGWLPFALDLTQLEVMQLHRDGQLDFAFVSEAERAVLKRATNPDASKRFEWTKDMVRALRRATQGGSDTIRHAVGARQARVETETRPTLITGREMVPGYWLSEHLFQADSRTDVWSAIGAGGKHCSLWIYDLSNLSEAVDLAALRTVQQRLQHAHLARISAWWCLDAAGEDITATRASKSETDAETDQLVIASEFSRTHLGHKAQERRELTDSGIPAEELIDYMHQASGAIDALNVAVYGAEYASLLHSDIRPESFLLVGNTVKLANLAWCRLLVGEEAKVPGLDRRPPRITMAPEIREGRLNRRCDQYSLAVSYVQLRSGKLYAESALPSATTQILSAPQLDLSVLNQDELTVINRALSHDPRQRFANCQSMVEALVQVVAKRRVPELVPDQKWLAEIERGTMMANPLPAAAETDVAMHRETSVAWCSTTAIPDMPRRSFKRRRNKARFVVPLVLLPLFAWAVAAYKQSRAISLPDAAPDMAARFDKQREVASKVSVVSEVPKPTAVPANANAQETDDSRVAPPLALDQPSAPLTPEQPLRPVGSGMSGAKTGPLPEGGGDEEHKMVAEAVKAIVQAEEYIRDRDIDRAKRNLLAARRLLRTIGVRADLDRRLMLANVYLSWQERAWQEADELLQEMDPAGFVYPTEADQLARYYLLRILLLACYDGTVLAEGADLDAISQAVDDMRKAVPQWAGIYDRWLVSSVRSLCRNLAARAVELAASQEPEAEALAAAVLQRLDPQDLPAAGAQVQPLKRPPPSMTDNPSSGINKDTTNQVEAVRRYAQRWQEALSGGNANAAAVYDDIVVPGIGVVEKMPQNELDAVAPQAAFLYATKGRLIRLDTAVSLKAIEEKSAVTEAVFAAYDKAIQLDPTVADYYIQRGTARYNSTAAYNNLEALKRDDIEPARKLLGGKETPGFLGLVGVGDLLEARAAQEDRGRRIALYKDAVANERRAVDQCNPVNEDYPQFLLLHSIACLELANSTTEPDETIHAYLHEAADSAQRAVADGRGAHPEFAWLALGNAHEDRGLLLQEYEGYRQAIGDFEHARLKALEAALPADEALIALGRVRYRLATCGAESVKSSDELLKQGLASLQTVIDAGRASPGRTAEAYWWQAQIHIARMQQASERASAPAAQKNAALVAEETKRLNAERAAADAMVAESVGRAEHGGPTWRNFQLLWAGLAATTDETRKRARAVLDVPGSKADGAQRAQALSLIANSYLAAATDGAVRRKQREDALREYRRYLPWLNDVSMAKVADGAALLGFGDLVLGDRDFWRDNRELCQASAERVLTLADEPPSPLLAARAHEVLAGQAVFEATDAGPVDLAALRLAAEHLKAAVDLDDRLAASGLTAMERQNVRTFYAARWRQALAQVDLRIASDPRTSAADAQRYRDDGLAALDNAKDLPAGFKQTFQHVRLQLSKQRRAKL